MSSQGNRFNVKKSGSPLKASKHQDKTNLISATDESEVNAGGTGVGAGVVLGANGSTASFYGSVMRRRKSGKRNVCALKRAKLPKQRPGYVTNENGG